MPWYASLLWAQNATPADSSVYWVINAFIALATIVVSVFLGGYLGKKLRMAEHGWKISLCLFTLLASIAVLLFGPPLKLGIDLRGGAILVYGVEQSSEKAGEPIDMDKLIKAISQRVNPGGQKEVTIRKYGEGEVEIVVPAENEAEVSRIEDIITRAGTLEFRILADRHNSADAALIERAEAEPSKTQLFDASGQHRLAWWVPVKKEDEHSFMGEGYSGIATRTREIGGRKVMEVLVVNDIYNVTGAYLTRADVGTDQRAQPCVRFNFNSTGAQLFGELTSTHLPDKVTGFTYKLGIILDGELYSAPSIRSPIYGSGEITGTFTQAEVQDLVNVLNAGSLPAALTKQPISRLYSGPTLGRDTIQSGSEAMLIAAILVPLFMLWYYRFSGLVADIALVLNMLMLFAIMLTIKAAFTLTGFAGLALVVGMAVDNNVLVYERLREELDRGATLRMAIRNAFQRASTTIIDANLTTLIAATVMYALGTDQVKGFAVALWLGVAISIYTSVFVARVIFDIAEKRRWITRVKMLRLIGHTNIDFMHWFRYCFVGSLAVILMAITVSFYRGAGLFDIDFTGGISVQALFNEPQKTAYVRDVLSEKLPDVAISDVRLGDEPVGLRFMINTSEAKMATVKQVLRSVFGDKLAHNTVDYAQPKRIEAATTTTAPEKTEPAPKAAEPPKKAQSRNDLPPPTMLAMADGGVPAPDGVAKQPAKEPEPAKPAATKAPPAAKTEPPETKQPAKATPKAEEPATEKPAEAQPAEAAAAAEKAFGGGYRTVLDFDVALDHSEATQLVDAAIGDAHLGVESVDYQLTNNNYVEGGHAAFKDWTLLVRLPPEKIKALLSTLKEQVDTSPIFPASSTIGAAVAGYTRTQAIYALVASWICMIIYLWVRFQGVAFGLAAVAALIHDVFIMLGAVAVSYFVAPYFGFLMIEPFKINLPIVAAFLTIIGYSVNDTIVVFDRIREVRGKDPDLTRTMVNQSTNQTLGRTLLTSFTVLLVVVVLYLFGGDAVHGFAFVLIVGVATGTYSSIYVAAPILLWLVGKREKTAAAR